MIALWPVDNDYRKGVHNFTSFAAAAAMAGAGTGSGNGGGSGGGGTSSLSPGPGPLAFFKLHSLRNKSTSLEDASQEDANADQGAGW